MQFKKGQGHHHHKSLGERLDAIEEHLCAIVNLLTTISQQGDEEMAQIDDLNQHLADMDAEIEQQTTVTASAVKLLQELKAAVDNIPQATDLSEAIAMAQAISQKLDTNEQVLADAVAANTPAAPTP